MNTITTIENGKHVKIVGRRGRGLNKKYHKEHRICLGYNTKSIIEKSD
jgi:hypothetical protein